MAYLSGQGSAIAAYGLDKTAGFLGTALKRVPLALKGLGRLSTNVPLVGTLVNPVMEFAGNALAGKGLKENLARTGAQAATGLISSPALGMAASVGADLAMDKVFQQKSAPPAHMPGAVGSHLPGMTGAYA